MTESTRKRKYANLCGNAQRVNHFLTDIRLLLNSGTLLRFLLLMSDEAAIEQKF